MSMTPPLVSMLRDPLLQERYDEHLAQLEELAQLEVEHNKITVISATSRNTTRMNFTAFVRHGNATAGT
jgi:predicted glycosyl hydrolase (DUF1957 family)